LRRARRDVTLNQPGHITGGDCQGVFTANDASRCLIGFAFSAAPCRPYDKIRSRRLAAAILLHYVRQFVREQPFSLHTGQTVSSGAKYDV
jgi:hypothetical protein